MNGRQDEAVESRLNGQGSSCSVVSYGQVQFYCSLCRRVEIWLLHISVSGQVS